MPKPTKAQAWLRAKVMEKYHACCAGCGWVLDLEYDHVHPTHAGGPDTTDNMQILCHACNNAKNGSLGLTAMAPRTPDPIVLQAAEIIRQQRLAFKLHIENAKK